MPETGAHLVIDALMAAGVRQLFSLSGNQVLALYDATIGRNIEIIHVRQEAAAVYMADGWARLTGQPGVALLTAGPGHCNAQAAVYVAQMSESPVVLLSGHCPASQIGTGAFQEMDQVAVTTPVAKAAWLVDHPDRIAADVGRALEIACEGRPGPVHLSLPADVLEGGAVAQTRESESIKQAAPLSDDAVKSVLERLGAAAHPLILAGPSMGRSQRWENVVRLSEVTGIPALPMESPRGLNDPWLHDAVNCLPEADLVLLVGKKLDFTLKFGQEPFFRETCRFIQIDADEQVSGTDSRVEHRYCADPSHAVKRLADSAQAKAWVFSEWIETVATARQRVPAGWNTLRRQGGRVHPLAVCAALQPWLDEGGILISDGGEFGQWVQAGLEADIRLINGPSGAIGNALPMGIAAKRAHPDRPVFVLTGDGAFGFHALELDTALRYHLPVVVIIGNDATWNAEHQLQIQQYGPDRTIGCDLLPTRYDTLAVALGGHGEQVHHPDDLPAAIQRSIDSGLPACINVTIEGAAAPTFFKSRPMIIE